MRSRIILLVFLGILVIVTLAFGEDVLKDKKDKLSYALGLNVGADLKQQSIEVNPDIFLKGIKDALAGSKRLLRDDEIRETMTAFTKEMTEKQAGAIKK